MVTTILIALQLVTLITLVSGFFLWSIRQKNATIESARQQTETARQQTETIKQQIALMRAEFESIAVEALGKRVSIMERELERMLEDNTELSQKVDVFEAEARKADEEFKDIRAMAREIMQMRHEELHHREKRRSRYYDEILENDDAESTPQEEET